MPFTIVRQDITRMKKLSYATMSRTVSEYRNSGMIDGASFDEIRDDVKRRGRRQ